MQTGGSLELSSRKTARLTGLFYLIIILGGLYGGLIVRASIVVPMAPEETLDNLLAHEQLFRMGFLADLAMVISDVMVSVLFYLLLKSTNSMIALFAMVFRLLQSSILGANLINLFSPVLLINAPEGLMERSELAAGVMQKMEAFEYGYLISGVFFAINCALMGYLLFKSELFPMIFGWLLGAAAFGYLFNCLAHFAIPTFIELSEMIMLFTAVIAELAFCLYLLVKGTRMDVRLRV
jgi:hypothetical protein